MGTTRAAIGFTVKSGWASAILLTGPASAPCVVDSRRIDLSDPAIPDSRQPYHEGFATARSGPGLTRLVNAVKRFGQRSVADLIRQHKDRGHDLRGVGIVVGSLIEPERIGNEHIRIHALEGRLFRSVVDDAAARSRLPRSIWRERDLRAAAAEILGRPQPDVREVMNALGRTVAGPWRAEHKTAALAAWLVLANAPRAAGRSRRATIRLPED